MENNRMPSRTVRIPRETHAKLRELARQTGHSMTDVLADAIDAYYRCQFLKGVNRDFARLRADATAWREELEERAAWHSC
jgi:hypothetical protein